MIVRIYILDDMRITKPAWLCPKCLKLEKAEGWDVKGEPKLPPHALECDRCHTVGDPPQQQTLKVA